MNDFRCSFDERCDQIVHLKIEFTGKVNIYISAIYAKYTTVGRRVLWQALEDLGSTLNEPWLVVGDFNIVENSDERLGETAPKYRDIEEFNEAFLKSGRLSVQFEGSLFTWTNGRLWQRLDRAAINSVWNDSYGFIRVTHLSRGRSDHCPLLIRCGDICRTAHSSFRFLNIWKNHPEFPSVIQDN